MVREGRADVDAVKHEHLSPALLLVDLCSVNEGWRHSNEISPFRLDGTRLGTPDVGA